MLSEEQTASSPLFEQSARDIVQRLQHDRSDTAREMWKEAVALVDTFRTWGERRPTDGSRIEAIQQLFDLNRRAMDYLASRGVSLPPTSSPGSRR